MKKRYSSLENKEIFKNFELTKIKNNHTFIILTIIQIFLIITLIYLSLTSYKNDVILNIILGYCVSYFFYVIQIYIPETNKKKKNQCIIKNDLLFLYHDLQIFLFAFKNFINISDNECILIKTNKLYLKEKLNDKQYNCLSIDLNNFKMIDDILLNITNIKNSCFFEYNEPKFIFNLFICENTIKFFINMIKTIQDNNGIYMFVGTKNKIKFLNNYIIYLEKKLKCPPFDISKLNNNEKKEFLKYIKNLSEKSDINILTINYK